MRNKIVRRLPSWQRPGVVSQQRLRLRRLILVNRIPQLRFESVSFLFLACFSIRAWWSILCTLWCCVGFAGAWRKDFAMIFPFPHTLFFTWCSTTLFITSLLCCITPITNILDKKQPSHWIQVLSSSHWKTSWRKLNLDPDKCLNAISYRIEAFEDKELHQNP